MPGESFTVVVATFGTDQRYIEWAKDAIGSAEAQTVPCEVIRSHEQTLALARNKAAKRATGDFLIFLDADDTLHPDYVRYMQTGSADIRQPSCGNPITLDTYLLEPKDLAVDNYLIIGCAVRRDMFLEYGGFGEYPILEDWALWAKLHAYGASLEAIPEAIYYITGHAGSRNFYRGEEFRSKHYHAILEDIGRWRANALYSRTWQ